MMFSVSELKRAVFLFVYIKAFGPEEDDEGDEDEDETDFLEFISITPPPSL